MKQTIIALGTILVIFYAITLLLTSTTVRSTNSANPSLQQAMEISIPRVPVEFLTAAQSLKNPVQPTAKNLDRGKRIFTGTGACYTCHGPEGKGDGPAGVGLFPPPRNFTDPKFHGLRTDGELYWVVTHGSPGSSMFAYAPQVITEEDAWYVVTYVQTLSAPDAQPHTLSPKQPAPSTSS
jgi:mono/diheme cytochrome c family protein